MSKWSAAVAVPALALIGSLASAAAHARTDVQWSITIGSPVWARPAPVYHAPPPVVVYRPAPVYYAPVYPHYRTQYHAPRHAHGYRDSDRDGIPNRYDRRYDPYGDRDRDGVPNRWDRHDRNPYRR
jgi:hypothetical protein